MRSRAEIAPWVDFRDEQQLERFVSRDSERFAKADPGCPAAVAAGCHCRCGTVGAGAARTLHLRRAGRTLLRVGLLLAGRLLGAVQISYWLLAISFFYYKALTLTAVAASSQRIPLLISSASRKCRRLFSRLAPWVPNW